METIIEKAKDLGKTYLGINMPDNTFSEQAKSSYNSLIDETENYFRRTFPNNEDARFVGSSIVYMYTQNVPVNFNISIQDGSVELFKNIEPFAKNIIFMKQVSGLFIDGPPRYNIRVL